MVNDLGDRIGISLHNCGNHPVAVIRDTLFEKPLVIDIFRVSSDKENQYDLPYQFIGQVMSTNFRYTVPTTLSTLGKSYGYQHLWKEAEGSTNNTNAKLTWFSNKRFYTLTTISSSKDKLLFTRIGANDPEFNLRRDASFIIRKNKEKNAVYVSIIEPHGYYNPVDEIATNAFSSISELELIHNSDKYSAIAFGNKAGNKWVLVLSNEDASEETRHQLKINGKNYNWAGPFKLYKQ